MEDGKLDPVIVSSCMVLKDETSENQVEAILDMVSVFGTHLCLMFLNYQLTQ